MIGPITRGLRNAFRNPLRTASVTIILGLSLGLVMVMLAARSAVDTRITQVKSSIGNTVTISPAGARGFLGGGEPLTNSQVDAVEAVSHVTAVTATIDAQLRTDTDTSLASAIDAGTLGNRGFRVFGGNRGGEISAAPADFTPPIFALGTNDPTQASGPVGAITTLTSGTMFDPAAEANEAVIGKSLAEKNSLTVGSTFTAFGTTITVKGLYDAGNQFANNSVVFPLKTLQKISSQTDQVTGMTAHVDSVDNLSAATSAIKSKLGNAADVTSSEDSVKEAVAPLTNIKTIATTSLYGALLAAALITLLTMVMVVRERRKEIAVLKAIGGGDSSIVTQFISESVVLTMIGAAVGMVLGYALSNPILKALLASNQNEGPRLAGSGPRFGGGGFQVAVGGFRALRGAVQNIQAVVDWHIIIYGLLAALVVAIIGSAVPAWLISKIRPAEVLRGE